MKSSPVEKTHSLARLETFSDAVIAVAITLMVLDLKPPDITLQIQQDEFDFSFLHGYWPKLLALALSFLMISTRWLGILSYFRRVSRASLALIWWTLLNLLAICLVPWSTAFLAEHPTLPQAVAIYGLVGLFLLATSAPLERHIDTEYPAPQEWNYRNTVVVAAFWGLSIPLAFVSIYLSFMIFAIVPALYIAPRKLHQRIFRPIFARLRPGSTHSRD
jgi:uncharacterized membrane protein